MIHLAEDSHRGRVNSLGDNYLKESTKFVNELTQSFTGKLIYASSSCVYGDNCKDNFSETDTTYTIDNYCVVKLRNEEQIINSNGTCFRLSNVFGKGMCNVNVMSEIYNQASVGNTICLKSLSPVRDFIHVSDVCHLIENCIRNFKPGIFNAGSGVGKSIASIAQDILNCMDIFNVTINGQEKVDSSSVNVLCINKTKKFFDWEPNLDYNQHFKNTFKK